MPEYDLPIPRNEPLLCTLMADWLASKRGERVISAHKEDTHSEEGIDLLADTTDDGGERRRFAIEHTSLELFEGQFNDDRELMRFFAPLERLGPFMPGYFALAVPVLASAWDRRDHTKESLLALAHWITGIARSMMTGQTVFASASELPIAFRLHCRDRQTPHLVLSRYTPEWFDFDQQHAEVVRKAVDSKCPKLARHQAQGCRSVLVLESPSGVMSAVHRTATIVLGMLPDIPESPDEIVFVETGMVDPPWQLWFIKRGAATFPEIPGFEYSAPHVWLGEPCSTP